VFLNDSELVATLEETDLLKGVDIGEGEDRFDADAPVQPCSVDLRIGGIYIPGTHPPEPGSAGLPKEGVVLGPGRTAVITTLEECNFPSHIGAIGFPPNSVSSKGILMTNPGHVDPGYRGPMSFTVINMGSEDYTLLEGKRIVTLLFFKLQESAKRDLTARGKGSFAGVSGLLSILSPDFLGIDRRVREASASEENRTRRVALWTPLVIGFLAVVVTLLASTVPLRGEVSDLKANTAALGEVRELEEEVQKLQGNLDQEGMPLPVEAKGE
jgi:deoxycytidine triphosphate deaminase